MVRNIYQNIHNLYLPCSQTKLNEAGQYCVFQVRRAAKGFRLYPDLAEQPLQILRFTHA